MHLVTLLFYGVVYRVLKTIAKLLFVLNAHTERRIFFSSVTKRQVDDNISFPYRLDHTH